VSLRTRLADPCLWARIHASAAVIWALLMAPSVLFWKESITWIIVMSAYANFAGSVASWTAARGDRNSPSTEDLARLERKVDALRGLVIRGR
jgi:hypothetical protein